jgi:hypothetical protein
LERIETHCELGGVAARGFVHWRHRAQPILRRYLDLDSDAERLHQLRIRPRASMLFKGPQRYPRKQQSSVYYVEHSPTVACL